MNAVRGMLCLMLMICCVVHGSYGETYVIDVYDVPIEVMPVGAITAVNLDVVIIGISDVSVRVVGVGGGGKFTCPGAAPDGWYELDVRITVGNAWYEFSTSNQVAFDLIAHEIESPPNPWSACEGVPYCVLSATSYAHDSWEIYCSNEEVVLPELSHVELTITADSIVSSNDVPWGRIKAMYSDMR